MLFYGLNSGFQRDAVLDQFISAIWTERFNSAGEVSIVAPSTPTNRSILRIGAYLALAGSQEVMQVENRTIEKGLITATGPSLLKSILGHRMVWVVGPEAGAIVGRSGVNLRPKVTICETVFFMAIHQYAETAMADGGLNWHEEYVHFLELEDSEDLNPLLSANGPLVSEVTIPVGDVYSGIQPVAAQNNIGLSLYLASADEDEYLLKFKAYFGRDLTSGQDVNDLVRFSIGLGSLNGVKDFTSASEYKNVVYAYAPGHPTQYTFSGGVEPFQLNRRTLAITVDVPDSTGFPGSPTGGALLALQEAYILQKAVDELANHNLARYLDGEANGNSPFKFGEHYQLGDIIELEDQGTLQPVRVAEYIRSQDATGEKAYPTVTAIL